MISQVVHSSKVTWKWRGALLKTTILCLRPATSFQLNFGRTNRTAVFLIVLLVLATLLVTTHEPPI